MPEVRLIDANALKDKISSIKFHVKSPEMMSGAVEMKAAALREIENAPTIDPEVRSGRWLSYTGTHYTGKEDEYGDPEYKEHIFFVCSNCRRKTVVRENFCPNCGARMDGGADNG